MHAAPSGKIPAMEQEESRQPQLATRKKSSGFPLWLLLVLAIMIFTVIALGYRAGFRAADSSKSGFHKSLFLEGGLRNRSAICESKRKALVKERKAGNNFSNAVERKTIDDLEDQSEDLKIENQNLYEIHTKVIKKNSQCEDSLEGMRKQREEGTKAEVDKLEAILKQQEDVYRVLSDANAGARRILLLHVLNQRRTRNYQLRKRLQLDVPNLDTTSYEETLIQKHNISEKADGFPDDVLSLPIRAFTRRRQASSIINKTESSNASATELIDDAIYAITSNWESFKYDSLKHKDVIFFIPTMDPSTDPAVVPISESNSNNNNNDDSDSEKNKKAIARIQQDYVPSYFDRKGNAPLVKGIVAKTQLAPFSLAQILRIIVRTAFCALRTKNGNLTVPYQYLRPMMSTATATAAEGGTPTSTTETISSLVETPLITFCSECSHTIQTKEFKLACEESAHSPSEQQPQADSFSGEKITSVYGSLDFWRTRSRVRFSPSVIIGADMYLRRNKMFPNTTLAVDFKRSSKWQSSCETYIAAKTLPLKHFMWLIGNDMRSDNLAPTSPTANRSIIEVSANDSLRQCAPTLENLRTGVITLAQQRGYIETVFIAASVEDKEYLDEAVRQADVGPLQIVISYPMNAMEDAIEMQIMSQSESILVNRYSEHSQHTTELYLLQNAFNQDGISFF